MITFTCNFIFLGILARKLVCLQDIFKNKLKIVITTKTGEMCLSKKLLKWLVQLSKASKLHHCLNKIFNKTITLAVPTVHNAHILWFYSYLLYRWTAVKMKKPVICIRKYHHKDQNSRNERCIRLKNKYSLLLYSITKKLGNTRCWCLMALCQCNNMAYVTEF